MELLKNISLGIVHGVWDSISGMTLILHIDNEINILNAQEEIQKQRQRSQNIRRSPSPTPSSASGMYRASNTEYFLEHPENNGDERSLESVRRKPKKENEIMLAGEKKIAKQVLKCCLLNGGFTWCSIIIFEKLLLPTLKFIITFCYGEQSEYLNIAWGWVHSILSILFGMMWVLPIFVLSKIVSSLWFADIANAAYRIRKGKPQMIPNLSKLVADFLFSLLVQALFLVQSMVVNSIPIPYLGIFLSFIHLCLLYSLYCFEYKWFNMGWELHRRLTYIETNWPYFLGFGVPLTIVTNLSNSVIVSSCIFSIFFPLFILSGNEAKPLIGTTNTPLRIFSPVIFFSNLLFNRGHNKYRVSGLRTLKQPVPQQIQNCSNRTGKTSKYDEWNFIRQDLNVPPNKIYGNTPDEQNYRYQQPPLPAHLIHNAKMHIPDIKSSSEQFKMRPSPERSRYTGGRPPLIPTPVSGAPQSPINSYR